ncbi:MAG: sulfotransferase [Desulfovibrionaceae bacterium]
MTRFLPRAVFITGGPRSGTNLLHRLFAGHPRLLAMPDTGKANFLRSMPPAWAKSSPAARPGAMADCAEFIASGFIPRDALLSILKKDLEGIDDYPEAVAVFVRALAQTMNRATESLTHFIEKNHNLEFLLHKAEKWFPDQRMIFLVRDPRDAWCSWKKLADMNGLDLGPRQYRINVGRHFQTELEAMRGSNPPYADEKALANAYGIDPAKLRAFASQCPDDWPYPTDTDKLGPAGYFVRNWQHMLRKARHNAQIAPGSFTLLRYEDLVASCKETMRRLAGFIELDYDTCLEYVDDSPAPSWKTILHGRSGFSSFHERSPGAVDQNSVGIWRGRIDPEETAMIESSARQDMLRYKYIPTTDSDHE